MVEPAGADVVGPAVAADDPYAAPDQVAGDAAQVVSGRPVQPGDPPLQLGDPVALRRQLGLAQLRRIEDLIGELGTDLLTQLGEPPPGLFGVPVGGQPQAQPELRVVLEQ